MSPRSFITDAKGTAGAEFALMLPFLLVLMFGTFELGHFFWTQHKLAEAVRDGVRYAARFKVEDVCTGATSSVTTAEVDKIKLMTRTGQLTNNVATPKVPGWAAANVTVTYSCQAFVSTGIYNDLGTGGAAPIVTVAATNVPYPSLLERLGLIASTVNMNARSSGPVIGI